MDAVLSFKGPISGQGTKGTCKSRPVVGAPECVFDGRSPGGMDLAGSNRRKRWELQVQAEFTYFAVFVLIAAILILILMRLFRAANSTIRQLNYESRRDKLQYERIEREKRIQRRALRRGTRKIDGKADSVHWNESGRRARRDYHIDEAADEVFDPVTDVRGMDVRTPWGWPGTGSSGSRPVYRGSRRARPGFAASVANFFKPREVVDEAYLARRRQSIRALVEDRYGRVIYSSNMSEFEWSKPELPREYLKEREQDQMMAMKLAKNVEAESAKFQALRLVADNEATKGQRKASGE